MRISLVILALVAGTSARSAAADERLAFFEKNIRPVLVEHCYECHAKDSSDLKGGLQLDSRAGLLKGGDSGPAIVPGKPGESLLIEALRHESLEMPPDRKLPAKVLTNFEHWIRDGAVDPRDGEVDVRRNAIDWDEARRFWAFRPIDVRTPPKIHHQERVRNTIDQFLLARLEDQGLTLQSPSDRLTLLRRVTFDLTGLPPTVAEIESFLSDNHELAYERLIERLLASPSYGPRWGRHWLDVVRYADSNGADENHSFPNAWRYRDYVIDAFNADLPYDDFLREQIAGDLLDSQTDADRHRRWTATGFLVLGPKMLAEQDKSKMLADIVDEQIDTLSLAFMGLTVGCARCHDHKFDPIPTNDYYALAGILHSTTTMADQAFVSKWNERYLVPAERIDELTNSIKRLTKERQQLDGRVKSAKSAAKKESLTKERKRVDDELKKQQAELAGQPSAMAVIAATPKDVPIHIRGSHLSLAKQATPRGVLTVTTSTVSSPSISAEATGRLELANWLADANHPLTARVIVNRIWQTHFGVGLCSTPNNFGLRGRPPTHPRLLDWLANEFIAAGWSIKSLHRLIVTSAAYRMSSAFDAASAEKDPSNSLLWRQRRRRLEVEPIRDAIFSIGQSLDRTMGGTLSAKEKSSYQKLKKDVFDSQRRAVYLPINRSAIHEMFTIFDYADASASMGRRPTTVVSHQALFMMNNAIVLEQSRRLASRLLAEKSDTGERLEELYLTVYGRPPTAQEIELANDYLARAPEPAKFAEKNRELESWVSYCRVLMAANEFIYID